MAEFTLTNATAVAVGSAVPYNQTVVPGGCDIRHRGGSGIVTIKGNTCCKNPRRYRATFHGNVVGVQGAMVLGMYLDGELLPETRMSVVGTGTTAVYSVDATTEILADCGCQALTVRVITGDAVTVNNAALIVDREA